MNWKNWPYWVKGALAGVILFPLLYVLLAGLRQINVNMVWQTVLLFCVPTGPTLEMAECLVPYAFSLVITFVAEFILIGAIIGWLYGKIKNRNTSSSAFS